MASKNHRKKTLLLELASFAGDNMPSSFSAAPLLCHGGIFLLFIPGDRMGNLINSEVRGAVSFFSLAETRNIQAKPQNADKTAAFLAFFACFAEQNLQKPARCGA